MTVGSGNTKTIAFAATDPELDPLTYTIAAQPQHGTLGPLIGNSVDYRPTDGFTGSDSFTFSVSDGSLSATGTISITVLPPVNNPPTPVNDTATTPEDTTATIAVLANDTDPNADALRLVSVTQPLNGVAHVEPDGTVHYVPVPDFYGSDSFTYKVCDEGTTDGKAAPLCSTATTDDWPSAGRPKPDQRCCFCALRRARVSMPSEARFSLRRSFFFFSIRSISRRLLRPDTSDQTHQITAKMKGTVNFHKSPKNSQFQAPKGPTLAKLRMISKTPMTTKIMRFPRLEDFGRAPNRNRSAMPLPLC